MPMGAPGGKLGGGGIGGSGKGEGGGGDGDGDEGEGGGDRGGGDGGAGDGGVGDDGGGDGGGIDGDEPDIIVAGAVQPDPPQSYSCLFQVPSPSAAGTPGPASISYQPVDAFVPDIEWLWHVKVGRAF